MATEAFNRRRFLLTAVTVLAAPTLALPARADAPLRLAAAWQDESGYGIGVLTLDGQRWTRAAGLAVPTRAHGLLAEANGSIVAIARRPGDWMLRWKPGNAIAQWAWAEPGRAYNGHAAASADGRLLYTSETDLDSGAALIGVRDAATLEKRDEWPTHGIDAHALLTDGDSLIVANGGVPTQPETGRVKRNLHLMDSSLVRLGLNEGALRGQWRLQDKRLSLRHLARNGKLIGIALQAEHDQPALRAAAPLLALFDGRELRLADPERMPALAGYGGDIAAHEDGFAIGAPRADRIAIWNPRTGWSADRLKDGCALTVAGGKVWAGGSSEAAQLAARPARMELPSMLRIDNHWVTLPPGA